MRTHTYFGLTFRFRFSLLKSLCAIVFRFVARGECFCHVRGVYSFQLALELQNISQLVRTVAHQSRMANTATDTRCASIAFVCVTISLQRGIVRAICAPRYYGARNIAFWAVWRLIWLSSQHIRQYGAEAASKLSRELFAVSHEAERTLVSIVAAWHAMKAHKISRISRHNIAPQ